MGPNNHTDILTWIFSEAEKKLIKASGEPSSDKLTDEEIESLDIVGSLSEKSKSTLAVLITSLTHKIFNPSQDIRLHQDKMAGGYSGRGIDTKYITPFLRENNFPYMASGSGWLTRSFEQSVPYNLDYPGEITPKEIKSAFLRLIDNIETKRRSPEEYLIYLFQLLVVERDKKEIKIAKPADIPINTVLNFLSKHFTYRYSGRGASRLPALAIYSIYECMVTEMGRFSGKKLMPLMEHTSPDRGSGYIGDIDITDGHEKLFESVEIKHGIKISESIIKDAYEKFKEHPVKRYYILSTTGVDMKNRDKVEKQIKKISKLHGCQVIVNGVLNSLNYYIRLLEDPNTFIDRYVENLKSDNTIKFEHRDIWNKIVSGSI